METFFLILELSVELAATPPKLILPHLNWGDCFAGEKSSQMTIMYVVCEFWVLEDVETGVLPSVKRKFPQVFQKTCYALCVTVYA